MPPVAPTTVTYSLDNPSAVAAPNTAVDAQLVGAGDRADDGAVVVGKTTTTTDNAGAFSLQLIPNSAFRQAGTYYVINIASGPSYAVVVPVSGSAVSLWDIRVDPLTLAPVPAVTPPIYLTRAERGAVDGVAALDATGKVPAAQLPVGGGSVPTSRQILTTSGLQGGGDLSADRTISPVYGSTAGTVCQGNDARLSDARTPVAHTHPYSEITGTVPTAALPPLAINETTVVANEAAMLALNAQRGDMAIRSDNGRTYVLASDSPGTLADWKEVLAAGQVQSVAGKTGVVSLVKGDVGLGNVDNTSDAAKPVSTAQQTALDAKAKKLVVRSAYVVSGNVNLNTGSSSWGVLPTFPTLSIPASVGDWVELDATILRQANANLLADIGVVVGGVIKRWLGNGATTTPGATYEGDVALYHTNLPARAGARGFVVTSDDRDGSNVVFAMLCRVLGAGSALILADGNNPFHWKAVNYGPVD